MHTVRTFCRLRHIFTLPAFMVPWCTFCTFTPAWLDFLHTPTRLPPRSLSDFFGFTGYMAHFTPPVPRRYPLYACCVRAALRFTRVRTHRHTVCLVIGLPPRFTLRCCFSLTAFLPFTDLTGSPAHAPFLAFLAVRCGLIYLIVLRCTSCEGFLWTFSGFTPRGSLHGLLFTATTFLVDCLRWDRLSPHYWTFRTCLPLPLFTHTTDKYTFSAFLDSLGYDTTPVPDLFYSRYGHDCVRLPRFSRHKLVLHLHLLLWFRSHCTFHASAMDFATPAGLRLVLCLLVLDTLSPCTLDYFVLGFGSPLFPQFVSFSSGFWFFRHCLTLSVAGSLLHAFSHLVHVAWVAHLRHTGSHTRHASWV